MAGSAVGSGRVLLLFNDGLRNVAALSVGSALEGLNDDCERFGEGEEWRGRWLNDPDAEGGGDWEDVSNVIETSSSTLPDIEGDL
jgi:hypothetical protein